jgi:hypothetical protein
MTYWIRDFEHSATGDRVRVYGDNQYLPALRRRVAKHLHDEEWLDDQVYRHDAGLDVKLEGEHPLHIEGLRFGEMLAKTAEQLEQECIRLLRANRSTREVQRVGIIAVQTIGTEPNWTYGEISPEPATSVGLSEADAIIASVAGRWALATRKD